MRHKSWYLLAVLTVVSTLNWADRQVVPILFPGIRAELGLTDQQLGVISGLAFAGIYALSGFAFGYAADRFTRKYIIAFGLVVWSLATVASGLAEGYAQLVVARMFTGMGEASLYPCALSLISERYPGEGRGRALGVFSTAAALGGALGIGLGGVLAERLGYRQVFLLYGAAGVLALPLLLSLDERPRMLEHHVHEPMWRLAKGFMGDKRLVWMWAAGTIGLASGQGYGAWVPSYFVRERGLSVGTTGAIFGLAALVGGVLGSIVGGILADRGHKGGRGGVLGVSVVTGMLGAALIIATIELPQAIAIPAGVLAPLVIYAFFPALQVVMLSSVPSDRHGVVTALNTLFLGGVGAASGPFLVGTLSDYAGLHAAVLAPAGGFVLASLCAIATQRAVNRQAAGRGNP